MEEQDQLRHFFVKQAMYIRLLIMDLLENLVNTDTDVRDLFHLDTLEHILGNYMNTVQFFTFSSLIKEQLYLILSCIVSYQKRDLNDITLTKSKLMDHAIVMGRFLYSLGHAYTPEHLIHICEQQNQYVIHIMEAQSQKQPARVSTLFKKYYDHMMSFSNVVYQLSGP